MHKNKKTDKTKMQILHEYLLSIGAREITPEEKQTEWYKKEKKDVKNLSCFFESEEEFEKLCNV